MTVWNRIYKNKKHISIWPWNNIIALTNRYFKKKNKPKILEIGCGYGANIPFFLKKNFDYYGLDISHYAISALKKKFPILKKKLFVLDIEKENIPKSKFDLVIDRGTFIHFKKKNNDQVIKKIKSCLRKNGTIISTYLISKKTTIDEDYKIFKIDNFYSKKKILKVFKDWKILHLSEEKKTIFKPRKKKVVFWNLAAKK